MELLEKTFRHGDVDGIPIELTSLIEIPREAKPIGKIVMQGTANGHSHRIRDGQVLMLEKPTDVKIADEVMQVNRFLRVPNDTIIEHEEHPDVEVLKGDYVIVQERNYNPFDKQIRRVID
ncbi:MAG: hypothetical protein HZC29_08680 [Thaumarchaeota archaeon]|nr:hypothetical protein [Nitrososphaerota archaeon]